MRGHTYLLNQTPSQEEEAAISQYLVLKNDFTINSINS